MDSKPKMKLKDMKDKTKIDPIQRMGILNFVSQSDNVREKLGSNPARMAKELITLKLSCTVAPIITVKNFLGSSEAVSDTEDLGIITISAVQRKGPVFMTEFFLMCRNMIELGGKIGLLGFFSIITTIYPRILDALRANSSNLGIIIMEKPIEMVALSIFQRFDNYGGPLITSSINNMEILKSEMYAIANLYMLMFCKKLTDENESWLQKRTQSILRRPKDNDSASYCMQLPNRSWTEVYTYVSSAHNLRAVIIDTYISLPESAIANNSLKSVQELMKWQESSHLGIISGILTTVSAGIHRHIRDNFPEGESLISYFSASLGDKFPYCKMILTENSYEPITKKKVIKLYAFCLGLTGAKTATNLKLSNNVEESNELTAIRKKGMEIFEQYINVQSVMVEEDEFE